MQALILEGPETIGIGDVDEIQVADDEILLDILAGGICGGDIKTYKGAVPGRIDPFTFPGLWVVTFAGRVVAIGNGVDGFAQGDTVALCFCDYCGACLNCRVGRPNFCTNARKWRGGGFTQQAAVYAPAARRGIFVVPPEISVAEAALCEPLTCAIGAVLKASPSPGERIVVIGLGGLGQFVAQILASAKATVIGIDIQEDKLNRAAAYCAQVIDASRHDVVDQVMAFTGGVGADVVMEVVGIPETFRQSFDLARMGGRIVIVGAHNRLADGVNVDRIFRRDLEIRAAKGASPLVAPDGTPLAFRYIQEGIVRPKELLTTFSFQDAQEAFHRQAHGDVIKGVICQD